MYSHQPQHPTVRAHVGLARSHGSLSRPWAPGKLETWTISTRNDIELTPLLSFFRSRALAPASSRNIITVLLFRSVPANTIRLLSKASVYNTDKMGGERDLSRLAQPKPDYPLLARKPVGKLIDNIYLGRIEREYKDSQYRKVTLASSVPLSLAGQCLLSTCWVPCANGD
jgi:hypothetical protein